MSVLLSFVVGTFISNLTVLVIYILSLFLYSRNDISKINAYTIIILWTVLLFYLLYSLTQYEADVLELGTGALYYIRGFFIVLIIVTLICYNDEWFFKAITYSFIFSSLLLLQSFVFEKFNIPFAISEFIPSSLVERQYSGYIGFFNNPNYWAVFALLQSIILLNALKSSYAYSRVVYIFIILCTVISLSSLIGTGSRMGLVLCIFSIFSFFDFTKKNILLGCCFIGFSLIILNEMNYSLDFDAIDKAIVRSERLLFDIESEERVIRFNVYYDELFSNAQKMIFGIGLNRELHVGPPHNTLVTLFRDFGLLTIAILLFAFSKASFFIIKNVSDKYLNISKVISLAIPVFVFTNDVIDSRPFWILLGIFIGMYFLTRRGYGVR